MNNKKKILIVVLITFVGMQFFIPEKFNGSAYGANDFTKSMDVPDDVKTILERSCFDCHSNHTNHMWYENIQPIGMWIGNHIEEGKDELNFSEFSSYKPKRKAHKMEEIFEMLEEDEMPLPSYLWIHGEAKLNPTEKELLVNWAKANYEKLKAEIPAEKK